MRRLASLQLPPTLVFADPFGFKGLSLQLFNAILKDWGCDCIFFFNFNSINRWVTTDIVREHMDLLFGDECAAKLRVSLPSLTPSEREVVIVNALKCAIKSLGIPFIHPFSFKDEYRDRTSHHLILATKHKTGYARMKDITARYSTESNQGIASFNFDPTPNAQGSFSFETPLDDLQSMLLNDFAGETISVREIHDRHCVDKPYRLPDYRHALHGLEERKMVSVDPPAEKRKGIFPDHVKVTFPKPTTKEDK